MAYMPIHWPSDLDLGSAAKSERKDIRWEESACPLCRGSQWATLFAAPERQSAESRWYAVVQCRECGICFTNPRPAQELEMDVLGPATAEWPAQSRRLPLRGGTPPTVAGGKIGLPWHGLGRILDIGGTDSQLLQKLLADGWKVTVLTERTPNPSDQCTWQEAEVYCGRLPHQALPTQGFDVITLAGSLQRLADPLHYLAEARDLLTPVGKLVVTVPNLAALGVRMFRDSWVGLDLPRNLVHFTPETLQLMLEHVGYAVQEMRMVRKRRWVQASAMCAWLRGGAPWWQRALQFRPLAGTVATYARMTGQAELIVATAVLKRR